MESKCSNNILEGECTLPSDLQILSSHYHTLVESDANHKEQPHYALISSSSLSEQQETQKLELPMNVRKTKRNKWNEEEQKEYWKQKKLEKKKRKKEASIVRKNLQQAEWLELSPEEQNHRRLEAVRIHELRHNAECNQKALCENNLANAHLPIIVFDLSFAWCMSLADTKSTVSQIKLGYSVLKHNGFPFRPVITSIIGYEMQKDVVTSEKESEKCNTNNSDSNNNQCETSNNLMCNDKKTTITGECVNCTNNSSHAKSLECCEAVLQRQTNEEQRRVLFTLQTFDGFRAFPLTITETTHWSSLYQSRNVIVLSADADDVLMSIEPDTVYVIGAFVDHNRYKNLTRNAACHHDAHSARLPLQEYMTLGNRCKVLTVNHVVEILARFVCNGNNWADAFQHVLPTRRVNHENKKM